MAMNAFDRALREAYRQAVEAAPDPWRMYRLFGIPADPCPFPMIRLWRFPWR